MLKTEMREFFKKKKKENVASVDNFSFSNISKKSTEYDYCRTTSLSHNQTPTDVNPQM